MVYIVVTAWFPPEKQAENLKISLSLMQKYPPRPELGEVAAQMVSVDEDGIKAMNIYKVKEGKYEESLMLVAKMMSEYWGIEDYRYTIRTWVTQEEAFAVIGQKMPG
ncbi:MAG: hypothetical protein HWN66_03415 [Candidatus Helarchaeota archaeon]|nr:hypothetical protein [Candidatus Helarchaeota archaeon]